MVSVTESAAFSSSGVDAISRPLSVTTSAGTSRAPNPVTLEQLGLVEELYEVEWTADEITKEGYQRVALQFPDELLHISVPIHQSLRKRLAPEIGLYVLADTSYGSCCVDEVAAEHINADVVVHYGYSCLSRPSRIPVLYVFSKAQLDIEDATQSLLNLACCEALSPEQTTQGQHYILIPDVAYAHVIDDLLAALQASPLLPPGSQIFCDSAPKKSNPSLPQTRSSSHAELSSGAAADATALNPGQEQRRRYTLPAAVPISSCVLFYIGPESLGLTNLLMTHPGNMVISYDPASPPPRAKIESVRTNRLLMRRYAVVQQARDADVIGILVGTLGVASYLPLLSHIRALLRRHQKKSYTLCVGKLNPAKLANFAEIECFVLVACPENSVIDAKEFLRPIITPFELCLALKSQPSWPGNYILDFEHVIEYQAQAHPNDDVGWDHQDENEIDADQPVFSLVTGKFRSVKRYGSAPPENPASSASSGHGATVALRNANNALTRASDSVGAGFLERRTFKGLEQRLGEDAPSVLEEGRRGIAKGYQDDHPYPEGAPG